MRVMAFGVTKDGSKPARLTMFCDYALFRVREQLFILYRENGLRATTATIKV